MKSKCDSQWEYVDDVNSKNRCYIVYMFYINEFVYTSQIKDGGNMRTHALLKFLSALGVIGYDRGYAGEYYLVSIKKSKARET